MSLFSPLARMAFGATPKMRRVLTYWAATAVLYSCCGLIVWRGMRDGSITPAQGYAANALGLAGVLTWYVLLRCAPQLKIANWKLAFGQAQFAIVYNVAMYAVLDRLGSAILIGMPVVIVFCAFALRPRQTAWLTAFAIVALGASLAALAVWQPQRHP
ncbi:MAG: GGDEF domain-containing protein, partial [Pseudomonadota bacterium]|nr:GGDEF domain-containing protein [Pseudomonadota bacterium]